MVGKEAQKRGKNERVALIHRAGLTGNHGNLESTEKLESAENLESTEKMTLRL